MPPTTRRKRAILEPAARRAQIVSAAVWAFARKGYRTASIDDIISKAGIARGTFYLYFQGKEEVFRACVQRFQCQVAQALAGQFPLVDIGTDARARLVTETTEWLSLFAAERDLSRIVLKEAGAIDARFEEAFSEMRRSTVQLLADRTRHLQDLGLVRASIAPETVAHLRLGMLDEALHAFVLADEHADVHEVATAIVDLLWRGIQPD